MFEQVGLVRIYEVLDSPRLVFLTEHFNLSMMIRWFTPAVVTVIGHEVYATGILTFLQ